jgi:hypothetical protein
MGSRQIFIFLALLLTCAAAPLRAQDTGEHIGKLIVEALKAQDFALLQPVVPTTEAVAKIMAQEDHEPDEAAETKLDPVKTTEMMQEKMRNEFQQMLQSASDARVKLPKLVYSKVLEENVNPEASFPMKGMVIELRYKGKPLRLAYAVAQLDGKWVYLGTLLSASLFQQLQK